MKKLIIASNNNHKILEIKNILSKYDIEVLSLNQAGINIEIEENGSTFMENALIKANTVFNLVKDSMVLADDSGLMVDALGGMPGIYSARFAGEHGNDKKNNIKLLEMMKGIPYEERNAKFVCAMALIVNKKNIIKVQGEISGIICEREIGQDGFGYDPLFYVPKYNKTFAQMGEKLKNSISHRAIALKKLENYIKNNIN